MRNEIHLTPGTPCKIQHNAVKSRSPAILRLAKALDKMNDNFSIQQREVQNFRRNMQSLQKTLLDVRDSVLSEYDATEQINIKRLNRKARRLVSIMGAYEARA